MPSAAASGIAASIWAPSSAPTATLSRMLAHEGSRESMTSRPWRAKKPSSLATTSGAQSVSGMKPSVTRRRSSGPAAMADTGSVIASRPAAAPPASTRWRVGSVVRFVPSSSKARTAPARCCPKTKRRRLASGNPCDGAPLPARESILGPPLIEVARRWTTGQRLQRVIACRFCRSAPSLQAPCQRCLGACICLKYRPNDAESRIGRDGETARRMFFACATNAADLGNRRQFNSAGVRRSRDFRPPRRCAGFAPSRRAAARDRPPPPKASSGA